MPEQVATADEPNQAAGSAVQMTAPDTDDTETEADLVDPEAQEDLEEWSIN